MASLLIGYMRVSTQDQNLRMQRDALSVAGCDRVFEEAASGAARDRPQLAGALDYMRAGDTLVVWRLDRLARSVRQLIDAIELLEKRQMGFRSLTESIDTTTPGGRLVFHVFAALAEFERGIIRERTAAGLAAARAQGRVGGRPPALKAPDIAVAKAMLSTPEVSVKGVARRLGVSVSTLYKHIPAARATVTRQEPL